MAKQEDSCAVDVLTFPSSHYALKAEKICKREGTRAVLIPLPREISADCGVALIVRSGGCQAAEELLRQAGILVNGVHHLQREGREARLWRSLLGG